MSDVSSLVEELGLPITSGKFHSLEFSDHPLKQMTLSYKIEDGLVHDHFAVLTENEFRCGLANVAMVFKNMPVLPRAQPGTVGAMKPKTAKTNDPALLALFVKGNIFEIVVPEPRLLLEFDQAFGAMKKENAYYLYRAAHRIT